MSKKAFPEDPVVQEVREIRRRLWKEAGGTAEGLLRLVQAEARAKRTRKRRTRRARN